MALDCLRKGCRKGLTPLAVYVGNTYIRNQRKNVFLFYLRIELSRFYNDKMKIAIILIISWVT